MAETNNYTKLKIGTDIASAVFVAYVIIILPLWCHYDPKFVDRDPGGNIPIQLKLLIADILPAAFGILWLLFRFGGNFVKKYPFIISPQFRLASPFIFFFLYLS